MTLLQQLPLPLLSSQPHQQQSRHPTAAAAAVSSSFSSSYSSPSSSAAPAYFEQKTQFTSLVSGGLHADAASSPSAAPLLPPPARPRSAFVPRSLVRRQLSLLSAEAASARETQRQLVASLSSSCCQWQQQTISQYAAIVAYVRQQHQQQQQQAAAVSGSQQVRQRQQQSAAAAEPGSLSGRQTGSQSEERALLQEAQRLAAAVRRLRSAAVAAEAAAATEASQPSASALSAFSVSLSHWQAERSALAVCVSSIRSRQAELQQEKQRLTAWKAQLNSQQAVGQADDWEAAKAALAAAGQELKSRHAQYEARLAAYKAQERRLRDSWRAVAAQADGLTDAALPNVETVEAWRAAREQQELNAAALDALRKETSSSQTAAASAATALPSTPAATALPVACPSCSSSASRCSELELQLSFQASQLTDLTSRLQELQEEERRRQQQQQRDSRSKGDEAAAMQRQQQQPQQVQPSAEFDSSVLLAEAEARTALALSELQARLRAEAGDSLATLERQQDRERAAWEEETRRLQLELTASAKKETSLQQSVQQLAAQQCSVQAELAETRRSLQELRVEAADALSGRYALRAELQAEQRRVAELESAAASLQSSHAALSARFSEERKRRKEFQFKYEDAKGKVRVYARVRPFTAAEAAAGERCLLRAGRNDWTLELNETQRDLLGNVTDKWRDFSFDAVFHYGLAGAAANGSQAAVFAESEGFAELCLQGLNCCIFAYGQSGTGKTFTMAGLPPSEANGFSSEQAGIKPRMIERVFRLAAEAQQEADVSISCYMVEIYLNALEDLFWKVDTAAEMKAARDPTARWPEAPELKVRADKRRQVVIDNVRIKSFTAAADMLSYCEQAERFRRVRKTGLNEASSRSHLVFALLVQSSSRLTGRTVRGKLSLVDLAGSERADKTNVDGLSRQSREAMQEEGVAINESLRMLKNVFRILGSQHLPLAKGQKPELVQYRGNMLTELMQDSLGGAAKTLMFVNVGPAASNLSESVDSLSYADLVNNITNERQTPDDDLTEQVRRLQDTLQLYRQRHGELT